MADQSDEKILNILEFASLLRKQHDLSLLACRVGENCSRRFFITDGTVCYESVDFFGAGSVVRCSLDAGFTLPTSKIEAESVITTDKPKVSISIVKADRCKWVN